MGLPVLALTAGDPAGIGPEIALRTAAEGGDWIPLLIGERAAFDAAGGSAAAEARERLVEVPAAADRDALLELAPGAIPFVDPIDEPRRVSPGSSGPADAAAAVASIDVGVAWARSGRADAMVTGPVSKASIARQAVPTFRGHTEYLAEACGLERYGRDYLMAFLSRDLQVALLSTHVPLVEAILGINTQAIHEALLLLGRVAGGRIAVAGINPHAGEGRLLGSEDAEVVTPAVESARAAGVDAYGPESADSLFARARRRSDGSTQFDWVLALYHDQGLIAVKTAAFGFATNWTLGLPILRTSVDHGTAFEVAGRGSADARPFAHAVQTTLGLLAGALPRRDSTNFDRVPVEDSPIE